MAQPQEARGGRLLAHEKTVKEQIELLKELQVIDREIYALNKEKNDIPVTIDKIEKSLEAKKTGIKDGEARLKNLQVQLKDKELSVQQKEEEIKKLQIQLYQLKTNKEYSAMLSEIEGRKADNSLIEEEMIKLMDEIEAVKNKIKEEKELFKNEGAKVQKEKDEKKDRVKEIDARLSGLSTNRGGITPNIEKGILAKYERVLKNRNGIGMVQIEGGACGGCYINLPPQVISEAKIKEDIVICGNCSRILYVDDNAEIN